MPGKVNYFEFCLIDDSMKTKIIKLIGWYKSQNSEQIFPLQTPSSEYFMFTMKEEFTEAYLWARSLVKHFMCIVSVIFRKTFL